MTSYRQIKTKRCEERKAMQRRETGGKKTKKYKDNMKITSYSQIQTKRY